MEEPMAHIASKLTDLIGNTPLLELGNYGRQEKLQARLVAKLESFNPLGCVKDRIGYAMIVDAEERASLSPIRFLLNQPAVNGNWPVLCCSLPGLPAYSYHAGDHEH
jgi:cysteine synthase A